MEEINIKEYLKYGGIILLLIINIAINIYSYLNMKDKKEPIEDNILDIPEEEPETKEELPEEFYVDIKGEIVNPGVYLVKKGTIVNDIINLAGGLNNKASTKYLNLSKEVTSEMIIYIYSEKEIKDQESKTEIKETCICKSDTIKECVDNKSSIIIESNNNIPKDNSNNIVEDQTNSSNNLININTATLEELTKLPGIGESKAQAIIEYRNTNGNFNSIEDIKNVSGIGEAAFDKIKDYITV